MELSTLLREIDLDMEFSGGINLILTSWTIVVDSLVVPVVNRVLDTESSMLTVAIPMSIPGIIACMGSSLVSEFVSLHNVKLWAILSTNTLGITVVESISSGIVST